MKKQMMPLIFAAAIFITPSFVNAEETLQSKINGAKEGSVIKLDKDYTEYIQITKDITIDLAGHTLKDNGSDENINVVASTLTISDSVGNGKIVQAGEYNAIELNTDYITKNTTTANTNEGKAKVILKSGTIESNGWGVTLFNNSEFIMDGGKVIATGDETYAICGNGTLDKSKTSYGVNAKIVINGGEVVSNDYAIYSPQMQGETIINGGKITGAAGAIAINRGKLTINGGILKSLGTDESPKDQTVKYNGPDWANNAVIATPAVYTTGVGEAENVILTITGNAEFVALGNAKLIDNAIPVIPANETFITNAKNTTKVSIVSGTFSSSVESFVDNNSVASVVNEKYVVTPNTSLVSKNSKGSIVGLFESTTGMPNTYSFAIVENDMTKDEQTKVDDSINKKLASSLKNMEISSVKVLGTYDITVSAEDEVIEIKGDKVYKVSILIDEALKNQYNTFKVIYLDNKEAKEIYDAKIENGYLVFNTTHLSTYSVVGFNSKELNNPKTEDSILLYIALGVISMMGIASSTVYIKQKNN